MSSSSEEVHLVEVNGHELAYLSAGSPSAERGLFVMLHGFPDTAHSWDALMPRVAAAGYYVVAPFLRGYAPSSIPDRDTTLQDLAGDLIGLIDALGAEQAIVLGNDWGAAAAYLAVGQHPERFSQLFVSAIPHPNGVRPSLALAWAARHFLTLNLPGAAKRFAANDFAKMRALYARWAPTWEPSEEELAPVKRSLSAPGSLNAAIGYYRAMRPTRFPKITVPSIAFAGVDDPSVPIELYTGAKRFFLGSYKVVSVPGGHFMHREAPQAFADALLRELPA